jgi:hypothetical protein
MSVHPYLARQAFDPEIINEMALALDSVCEALSLRMLEDPATCLVAEAIIKLTQRGVRGDMLRTMTLRKFDDE